MQNEQSTEIIKRFILVVNELIEVGILHGKKSFTDHYKINRWNFSVLMKEPWREIFQVNWLAILCKDFRVNAEWLLLGAGERYNPQMTDLIQSLKVMSKQDRKKHPYFQLLALPKNPVGRPNRKK